MEYGIAPIRFLRDSPELKTKVDRILGESACGPAPCGGRTIPGVHQAGAAGRAWKGRRGQCGSISTIELFGPGA